MDVQYSLLVHKLIPKSLLRKLCYIFWIQFKSETGQVNESQLITSSNY